MSFPGPHAAYAAQDEKHLFVVMKMIGRAARGNRTDKLRHLRAADFFVDKHSIPAVCGRDGFTIGEAYDGQSPLRRLL